MVWLVASLSSGAWASAITPTAGQAELNELAFEAARNDDHQRAVELLQASLVLGEINVSYLNLGRSLSRLNNCDGARRAYDRVADAPHVQSPSREEVLAVLDKYRSELDAQCALTIAVDCPAFALARVDNEDWQSCPLPARPYVAGSYQIEVRGEGLRHTQTVELNQDSIRLNVENADLKESASDTLSPGWYVLGGGIALTVTAIMLEAWLLGPSIASMHEDAAAGNASAVADWRDSISTQQELTVATYILGGLGVAAGVTWLLVELLQDEESSVAIAPLLGPEQTGLSLSMSF
jgi:hypothetical protein